MRQLESVKCSSISMTDSGATHLSEMWNLRELDVSRTKVTDKSAEAWSSGKAEKLQEINVASSYVSGGALRALEKLARLRRIDMRGCSVTPLDVKSFICELGFPFLSFPFLCFSLSLTKLLHTHSLTQQRGWRK